MGPGGRGGSLAVVANRTSFTLTFLYIFMHFTVAMLRLVFVLLFVVHMKTCSVLLVDGAHGETRQTRNM